MIAGRPDGRAGGGTCAGGPSPRSSRRVAWPCLLAALLGASGAAGAQDLVLRIGHVVPGDGPVVDGAAIVIQGGRVTSVVPRAGHGLDDAQGGRGGPPEDAQGGRGGPPEPPGVSLPRVERPAAWALPGLVDAATALGLRGRDEAARALAVDVDAATALDLRDPALGRALRAGITTAAVLPGPRAVFGGLSATVRTTGELVPGAPPLAVFSLGALALHPARPPTSLAAARDELAAALEAAHASGGAAALERAARGEVPALLRADRVADARALLASAARWGARFALAPGPAPGFEALPLRGVVVVLGPFDLGTPAHLLRRPGALHRAGARVVLTSGAPDGHPAGLRLTAALAAAHGLPADAALAAITSAPADLLGLAGRAGRLTPGADADVVLLDGPPLDPASRVLAVYVRGRLVSEGAERATEGAAAGHRQDRAQRGPASPRERAQRATEGTAGGGSAATGHRQDLAQRGPEFDSPRSPLSCPCPCPFPWPLAPGP